jgi:hypothetical protein
MPVQLAVAHPAPQLPPYWQVPTTASQVPRWLQWHAALRGRVREMWEIQK